MAAPDMPVPEFPVPKLTFGVELEMCFVARRKAYYDWLGLPDPRPNVVELIDLYNKRHAGDAQNPPKPSADESEHSNSTFYTDPDLPSEAGSSVPITTKSYDAVFQQSFRQYMVYHFKRKVPSIGDLHWGEYHEGGYPTWVLTDDASIEPKRMDWAEQVKMPLEEMKPLFLVGGAELISEVLDFPDMRWKDTITEIYTKLKFDGDHGIWLGGNEGLHVHFAVKDEPIGLETLKNLITLYGLFETEIELWLETRRRRDPDGFCLSLRRGMEIRKIWDPTINRWSYPGLKYTPNEFTERIYSARSVTQLLAEVSCFEVGASEVQLAGEYIKTTKPTAFDEEGDDPPADGIMELMDKYLTLYISPPRVDEQGVGLKPLTLEFRHHEGTTDPEVIKWWVMFCGSLVSHARLMALNKIRILDEGDSKLSFVEQFTQRSILEVINFPEDGIAHFARRKEKLKNPAFEARRELEERLIERRVERRRKGEVTGRAMDDAIKSEAWYIDALEATEAEHPRLIIEDNIWGEDPRPPSPTFSSEDNEDDEDDNGDQEMVYNEEVTDRGGA